MTADLWTLVETAAGAWPDDPMLVSRQGDGCTFGEFRARAESMAAGLHAVGVGAGTRVTWVLPTWVDTVVLSAALSRLGAVQNPIIAISRDREVGFCVDDVGAELLITPQTFGGFDFAAMGERLAADRPGLRHLAVEPGAFPSGPASVLSPFVERPADETAWVCYTSGTTAAPKGARHSDATVGTFAVAMAERMDVQHGDRYSLVFPFPHIGGVGLMFVALHVGCTHLLDAVVDPVATVEFLAERDCTHAGTGPAFFNMFLAAQAARDTPLFPSLKVCPSGGAPTPVVYFDRIRDELGGVLVASWGLTEAPVLTAPSSTDPHEVRVGSVGRPLPGVDLRVVDGELRVKAPQVMLGYQDASLDEAAFDADGYYRTGDLGVIAADGSVSITGRLKDVIIRNGENISATEVEDFLHSVDGIAEAAVVAVPDERTGEAVCAVIVPSGEPPSLETVVAALTAAGLRRVALPTRMVVRSTLPRSPAGKVVKQQLLAEL